LGLLVGPLFGGPRRGLNEEWAKASPWARGQIDTSTIDSKFSFCSEVLTLVNLFVSGQNACLTNEGWST